jgi:hypothetical protein
MRIRRPATLSRQPDTKNQQADDQGADRTDEQILMQEDVRHGTSLLSQSAYCNHLREIVEQPGPIDLSMDT